LNAARGATNPVSFISSAARERLFVHVNACRGMPEVQPRRIHPSPKVRTNYETDPGIREGGILHRLQNSIFSNAYVKNTELANDFVLPRLIKMFSRKDGYFAGAPRH
jgi:hypothetical protein